MFILKKICIQLLKNIFNAAKKNKVRKLSQCKHLSPTSSLITKCLPIVIAVYHIYNLYFKSTELHPGCFHLWVYNRCTCDPF